MAPSAPGAVGCAVVAEIGGVDVDDRHGVLGGQTAYPPVGGVGVALVGARSVVIVVAVGPHGDDAVGKAVLIELDLRDDGGGLGDPLHRHVRQRTRGPAAHVDGGGPDVLRLTASLGDQTAVLVVLKMSLLLQEKAHVGEGLLHELGAIDVGEATVGHADAPIVHRGVVTEVDAQKGVAHVDIVDPYVVQAEAVAGPRADVGGQNADVVLTVGKGDLGHGGRLVAVSAHKDPRVGPAAAADGQPLLPHVAPPQKHAIPGLKIQVEQGGKAFPGGVLVPSVVLVTARGGGDVVYVFRLGQAKLESQIHGGISLGRVALGRGRGGQGQKAEN